MSDVTGGCLCGKVRFVASGDPYRVGLCHCMDCRKHHGALFHASAVFPQSAVTIEGKTGAYEGRYFCRIAAHRSFPSVRMKLRSIWGPWMPRTSLNPPMNYGPSVGNPGCPTCRAFSTMTATESRPVDQSQRQRHLKTARIHSSRGPGLRLPAVFAGDNSWAAIGRCSYRSGRPLQCRSPYLRSGGPFSGHPTSS